MADVWEVAAGGLARARGLQRGPCGWVRQDDFDKGLRTDGPTTTEREELRLLRAEGKTLRMAFAAPMRPDRADTELVGVAKLIRHRSRGTYGAPVHAELAMEFDIRCGRERVARLMRNPEIAGVHRRRRSGLTIRDPKATPAPDL